MKNSEKRCRFSEKCSNKNVRIKKCEKVIKSYKIIEKFWKIMYRNFKKLYEKFWEKFSLGQTFEHSLSNAEGKNLYITSIISLAIF